MRRRATLTTRGKTFLLDGKPFFIFSGEIHYFRMPQKLWKKHLAIAAEAGLNTVSTYIPWSWHESAEGRFDFEGKTHPQRNLLKFMDLAREAGLYFSARVGPVSNAELTGEGLPGWLLRDNPDIFVQRQGVNNLPHAILLSYLNPKFQDFVRKWYDRVLPLVAERQVQRGGNVVLVQLCNEIGMIHWLHKAADQSAFVTDMYRDYLKERYGSIESLNRAYGTHYKGFAQVKQPAGDVGPENLLIFFDWALFFRRYYARYYRSLSKMAAEKGISVPLSANIPQFYDYDVRGRGVFSPMTTSLYRDFPLLTPGTVFGGAYQMRRLDFENFHDVSLTTEVVKSVAQIPADGGWSEAPVVCAELQTGIMRDRPRLYPADVDLNVKTSVAHGLNGVNCYMFSSGHNIPGMGAFGSYHDWQAPVSLEGEKREHLEPLRQWGRFLRRHGSDLAGTEKVADTALGFYLPYYATEYFSGDWNQQIENLRTQVFFDGFARLTQLAGYQFSVSDLMKEPARMLQRRESLAVFSLDAMDPETQAKLADYVRDGGRLILGPRVPTLDLKGKPCNILSKALGLKTAFRKTKEMLLWNKIECSVEFPIQVFQGSGTPLVKSASGHVAALAGSAGRGRWLAFGFGSSHVFDYQAEMVGDWFARLGVRPQVTVKPWDLHAVARRGGDRIFLFLMNFHDVDKKGEVKLDLSGDGGNRLRFEKAFPLKRRSSAVLPLKISHNKITEVQP